jgi:hypothetical protein
VYSSHPIKMLLIIIYLQLITDPESFINVAYPGRGAGKVLVSSGLSRLLPVHN